MVDILVIWFGIGMVVAVAISGIRLYRKRAQTRKSNYRNEQEPYLYSDLIGGPDDSHLLDLPIKQKAETTSKKPSRKFARERINISRRFHKERISESLEALKYILMIIGVVLTFSLMLYAVFSWIVLILSILTRLEPLFHVTNLLLGGDERFAIFLIGTLLIIIIGFLDMPPKRGWMAVLTGD